MTIRELILIPKSSIILLMIKSKSRRAGSPGRSTWTGKWQFQIFSCNTAGDKLLPGILYTAW